MVGGLLAGRYCREVGDNALQCAPSLLFLKEMFQTPKREKSRTLSSKFKGGVSEVKCPGIASYNVMSIPVLFPHGQTN
jgi:hypothetical protein